VSEARQRDRFIEKVGCFLIAIPVGAFIVTQTAEALGVPPAGVLVGAVIVAFVAGGFGSSTRATHTAPPIGGPQPAQRSAPRRNPYEQMRDIVERYESGEISAERRDEIVRALRR
jgi:hypothetical protein